MKTRNEINEAAKFSTTFRMNGDSMYNGSRRSFADGDYLRCDEVNVKDIQVGCEYVIRTNDTYLVRQVTNVDDEVVTCAPLNPLYKESQLCIEDIRQMFIVRSYQTTAEF